MTETPKRPERPALIGDIIAQMMRENPPHIQVVPASDEMSFNGGVTVALIDRLAKEARSCGNVEAQAVLIRQQKDGLERDLAASKERNTALQGLLDGARADCMNLSKRCEVASKALGEEQTAGAHVLQVLYELHATARDFANNPAARRPGSPLFVALGKALTRAGELTSKHVPF